MRKALLFSLCLVWCFGCDAPAPASLPAANQAPAPPKEPPQDRVFGMQFPGCETFKDGSGVGSEGASFTRIWAGCVKTRDEITAWLDEQVAAGALSKNAQGLWLLEGGTIEIRDLAKGPKRKAPPAEARSLLLFMRDNKPPPCPPCTPEKPAPPGCSCR